MKKDTKTKIESLFGFDEEVTIKPLSIKGRIESFWLNRGKQLQVEVRYFLNNAIKKDYFYEDELEVVKETKTGF